MLFQSDALEFTVAGGCSRLELADGGAGGDDSEGASRVGARRLGGSPCGGGVRLPSEGIGLALRGSGVSTRFGTGASTGDPACTASPTDSGTGGSFSSASCGTGLTVRSGVAISFCFSTGVATSTELVSIVGAERVGASRVGGETGVFAAATAAAAAAADSAAADFAASASASAVATLALASASDLAAADLASSASRSASAAFAFASSSAFAAFAAISLASFSAARAALASASASAALASAFAIKVLIDSDSFCNSSSCSLREFFSCSTHIFSARRSTVSTEILWISSFCCATSNLSCATVSRRRSISVLAAFSSSWRLPASSVAVLRSSTRRSLSALRRATSSSIRCFSSSCCLAVSLIAITAEPRASFVAAAFATSSSLGPAGEATIGCSGVIWGWCCCWFC
mmetsp:Transcript_10176/g.19927  ORF Transcript_10176/g.19927 Transcript_10176/m.19927 type:complete len:404 (+) Transcript_10176:405-1616(+)